MTDQTGTGQGRGVDEILFDELADDQQAIERLIGMPIADVFRRSPPTLPATGAPDSAGNTTAQTAIAEDRDRDVGSIAAGIGGLRGIDPHAVGFLDPGIEPEYWRIVARAAGVDDQQFDRMVVRCSAQSTTTDRSFVDCIAGAITGFRIQTILTDGIFKPGFDGFLRKVRRSMQRGRRSARQTLKTQHKKQGRKGGR